MVGWRHLGWLLVLACGQPQRVAEPQPAAEPQPGAEPQPAAEAQPEARPEPDRASVVLENDPLPEIPVAEIVEWPESFAGRPIEAWIAEGSLMALYRDEGHRAFELELVPLDADSGWVVDRGIVTSPDYSQALYERWSRVQLREGALHVLEQVGRSEAQHARTPSREARFDAIASHYRACVDDCDSRRCEYRCGEVATQQINAPHRLTMGDARVTIHAPTIRIEWREHGVGVDAISRENVDDHPTRPVPFFARVRRARLDRTRDAIVIHYGHHCDEDAYCPTTRVFVLDDGVHELPVVQTRTVELPGDGTIRWVGREERTCEPTRRQRAAHMASLDPEMEPDPDNYWWHQQREIRHGLRVAADRSTTSVPPRARPWDECTASIAAACPHVDIVADEGTTRVGEILRWVRDAPGTQGLALPPLSGERVRIRLSEEKPETTYLDAVWLELDGERVDPMQPMATDGRYVVLNRGDAIELEFPLHAHSRARLVAVGYYVVRASIAR